MKTTSIPTWPQHVARWKDCTECPLCEQRDNIVLARGQLPCDVLFVGEAPGDSENFIGQPFMGPAGHLLDRIVAAAMPEEFCSTCLREHNELVKTREVKDEYTDGWTCLARFHDGCSMTAPRTAFCNLVCCFPKLAKEAGDNEPLQSEIDACAPRLEEFIAIARPRLVVAVGKLAENNLPLAVRVGGTVEGHATVQYWTSITHPAHILRMPLVQQGMAVQRNVVILSNALENLL